MTQCWCPNRATSILNKSYLELGKITTNHVLVFHQATLRSLSVRVKSQGFTQSSIFTQFIIVLVLHQRLVIKDHLDYFVICMEIFLFEKFTNSIFKFKIKLDEMSKNRARQIPVPKKHEPLD